MTVRPATEADVEAIRRVAERSWETDYPDILTRETAETGVEDWYDRERIRAAVDEAKTLLLVVERNGDVVGFAHGNWRNDEGHLLRIYVDPDHRRAGVGRELLVETCGALFDRGVDEIGAMVLSANEPGRAFYERFGFEHGEEAETTIAGEAYPESRYVLRDRGDLETG